MKARAFLCVCLALSLLLPLTACAPAPAPSATSTPPPTPPVRAPTATPLPSVTLAPTLPVKPELVGQVALDALPAVGHAPQAMTILDGRVYVANRGTDNVSVIEGNKVTAVVPVGQAPVAVAADPTTGLVYIACETDNEIAFLSGDKVVGRAAAPESPACLAALDGRLYVGARAENELAVLDGISGERIATVKLKASIGILALAVQPLDQLLYAAVYDGVEIVDLQRLAVVGRLERQLYTTLGVDPAGGRFFIGEYDSAANQEYLVAFDALGKKEQGRVRIGGDPRGMAVDARSGRIYVANSWTNDVSVIDGKTLRLVATVPVGLQPLDVAVGADGVVYVANANSDNVAVLDGQSPRLLGVIPLSALPRGVTVHPKTGRVYVACAGTNSVCILEDGKIVGQVPVGLHPTEVALSPDGETLYVLNYVSGDLTLVSTSEGRALKTVEVGPLPKGLAVAPRTAQLYVGDVVLDGASLRVLRHTELLTAYRSQAAPEQIQIDPQAQRAYMVASNGVPGSNGGLVLYVVDLETGKRIESGAGGLSMTGLALDLEGQRVFSTAGRFGYYSLLVDDAGSLKRVASLALERYPAALAYNPKTHHIFLLLTSLQDQSAGATPELWVLDSRGLGTVATLALPGKVGFDDSFEMAVDTQRGYVYVADTRQGSVHVLRDVTTPIPPTPLPTRIPTPWPTLTPEAGPRRTQVALVEPTCSPAVNPRFTQYWEGFRELRLGLRCPLQELQSSVVAEQAFEHGSMLWRQADRSIWVFFNDGQWRSFADGWQEGAPDTSCEVTPPAGLQQPKRGFGLVWCKEPGVKEGLGWATGDEVSSSADWQPFEGGQIMASTARSLVLALFSDGHFAEYPSH